MTDHKHTPAEARALWTQALRSGDYQQTKGALQRTQVSEPMGELVPARPIGYCCLGVACEMYEAHEGGLRIDIDDDGYRTFNGEEGVLPDVVAYWLGICNDGGMDNNNLVDQNDHSGATFSEIADLIDDGNANGLFS